MKTATEWLFEQLWDAPKDKFTWYGFLHQAREMEINQMRIEDEEIEKEIKDQYTDHYYASQFREGTKWYRQKVCEKNQ